MSTSPSNVSPVRSRPSSTSPAHDPGLPHAAMWDLPARRVDSPDGQFPAPTPGDTRSVATAWGHGAPILARSAPVGAVHRLSGRPSPPRPELLDVELPEPGGRSSRRGAAVDDGLIGHDLAPVLGDRHPAGRGARTAGH